MPNMPNFGNVAGMAGKGSNVFEHRAVRKLAGKIMRKANANAAAKNAPAPSYSGKTGGASTPAPSPEMGQQMAQGRANRAARAQNNRQQAGNNLAARIQTQTGSYKGATPVSGSTAFPGASKGQANAFATRMKAQAAGLDAQQHGTPASTPTAHGTSSAQFSSAPAAKSIPHAAVNVGSNAPYPTHTHPAGSSTQILPHTSSVESAKGGAPNTFTVGSRNAKSHGIAAMGSRLEASLNSRPLGTPAKAGGSRPSVTMPTPTPTPSVQPQQFGGKHRAAGPTNVSPSSAPGTGKRRLGNGTPNIANALGVSSMPSRIGHVSAGAPSTNVPQRAVSAPSSHIPSVSSSEVKLQQSEAGHQAAMAHRPAPNVGKGSQTYFSGMPKKGPKPPTTRNVQPKQFGGGQVEGQESLF